METFLGFLVLGALVWLARRHDRDHERQHGPLKSSQRLKSFGVVAVSCPLLIVLCYLHLGAYAALSAIFIIGLMPLGTGRWSNFRALRDGLFVGWLLSLPIVFVLYASGEVGW